MLFNSFEFLFIFLPVVVLGAALAARATDRMKMTWLALSSLVFYACWNVNFLPLLLISISVNFALGRAITQGSSQRNKRLLWYLGVTFNLGLLFTFKYAHFALVEVMGLEPGAQWFANLILPLGISFFTFQQITYLHDALTFGESEKDPIKYALYVSFFPQLIAGPIVHFKEVSEQLESKIGIRTRDMAIGLALFSVGLFKKVIIADKLSKYAGVAYGACSEGEALSVSDAWLGSICYSLQIYYDFSGYSDMAIGLGRIFGIILPLNFFSPYQATNLIDFWRRWHITLSTFLKDRVYIPLGGNRGGAARRYINLLLTMVIGGIWHGAGWTFILWGACHGVILAINHGLRKVLSVPRWFALSFGRVGMFVLVTLIWVLFRSPDLDTCFHMFEAMVGMNTEDLPRHLIKVKNWGPVLGIVVLTLYVPNVYQFLRGYSPALGAESHVRDQGNPPVLKLRHAIILAIAFVVSVFSLSQVSEFLYYQF